LAWFVWVFAPLVSFFRCFSLGCLHLWCGLGALTSRRHGVVCSRWAFALGVHGVLSCWAAAAAAVAAPSLCAVYFFVGSSDQSSHTSDNGGGVFCQSAIDSAQNDHANVVQSMLANKEDTAAVMGSRVPQ